MRASSEANSFRHRRLWRGLGQLSAFLLAFAEITASYAETPGRVRIMEAYPETVRQRLGAREQMLRRAIRATTNLKDRISVQYVLDTECRWDSGSTLTVAFSGGTPELHAKIEAAASEWSKYCNIKFDFRVRDKFREWSPSAVDYQAQIRIAFMSGDQGGYWSALGNDSANPNYYPPNKASMNFDGFPTELPWDYATTVQHEFGHAIGFWHEHQHPKKRCDEQLRWNDDFGYVPTRNEYDEFVPDPQGRSPGVYTVFGGPPNSWSKDKIDFAMKHISDADTHAYKIGPFDRQSIMKYYYPAWLFIDGDRSRCYHDQNLKISAGDRHGAAAVYPKKPAAIRRGLEEKKRVLEMILQMKRVFPELEHDYRAQRDSLPK